MKIRKSAIIAHIFLTLPHLTSASYAIIQNRQRIAPSNSLSQSLPISSPTISTPPPSSISPTLLASPFPTISSTPQSNSTIPTTSSLQSSTTSPPSPPKPTATQSTTQQPPAPQQSHSMSSAALTGVVLAGVALVIISGVFLWLVHFRTTGRKKPSPFRRASVAVKDVQMKRTGHIRIEDFVASNMSSVSVSGNGFGLDSGHWGGSYGSFGGTGTGTGNGNGSGTGSGTGSGMGTTRVGYV